MEHHVRIDRAEQIAYVTVLGGLEVTRFEAIAREFQDQIVDHPQMPAIFDVSQAQMESVTAEELRAVREINERLSERRGKVLLAIVTGSDLQYGVARMYEALGASPNLTTRVFRDAASAREWILAASKGQGSS